MHLGASLRRGFNTLAAALKPPRLSTGEVGSGFSTSGGIPEIDYIDELGFPDYIEAFKRVANDPQVAREIRSVREPIIAADRKVEPASDDPRDVQIAEFVAANLYQDEGELYGRDFWCLTDADDRLRDALRMLENGFALFQVIWRKQGRFYVYDKFKYLLPDTIERFAFEADSDVLIRIERTYMRADGSQANREIINAENLFIYTWNKEGSNILGKPFIREMWKPYNFKVKYEKFAIIDKQRTAVGVPWFENPAGDSPENITRGEQIAKAMRGGNSYERLWVRKDAGQDFGWKEGGQSTKGLPDLVRLQNEEISTAGMAAFMGLGREGSSGSRGVAGTQASFSSLVMTGGVRNLVKHENALIGPLVDFNFPGVPRRPKAKLSNVDPFEKTRSIPEFVQSIATLRTAGGDLDTENEIRRRYGFMEVMSLPERNLPQFPPSFGGNGEVGEPTATAGRRRSPIHLAHPNEELLAKAKVSPDAIRRKLEVSESLYFDSLRHVRRDMIDALVASIRSGELRPKTVGQVKVPFQTELRDRLLAIAKATRDFGREQIEKEIRRQDIRLEHARPPDPSTRRGAISFSNREAEVLVNLDVGNLTNRLQSEVVSLYNRLAGSGLDDDEIARQIDEALALVSDRQIADMARQSTAVTFNAGRNVGILENRDVLEDFVVRVEVDPDDPNTCDPCQELNGKRFKIGSAEYLQNQPPNYCKGKQRCRGFYAVFAKGA